MAKYKRQKRTKYKTNIINRKHVLDLSYPYSFRGKTRKQKAGFLSRYDFAYAAYQAKKIAPELIDKTFDRARDLAPNVIRAASRELDALAARRINQITRQTGQEIQRIAPGIIKGADFTKRHLDYQEHLGIKNTNK